MDNMCDHKLVWSHSSLRGKYCAFYDMCINVTEDNCIDEIISALIWINEL